MRYLILIMSMLFAVACGASNGEKPVAEPEISVLAADRFCGHKEGISLITSSELSGLQPMVVTQTVSNTKLDWSQFQILRINMGTQPNLGYSLSYAGGASLVGQRLIIPITWNRPEPGRMYAQMLVEPCLLLAIPRQGYEYIDVIDQDGHLRWSLNI